MNPSEASSELVPMDMNEQAEFAKDSKENAQKMLAPAMEHVAELKRIIKDCDEILDWIELQPKEIPRETAENLGPDLYSKHYVDSIKERFSRVKTSLYLMYYFYGKHFYDYASIHAQAGQSDDSWAVFEVKAKVKNQCLLVKLPLLWSRYVAFLHNKKGCHATDSLGWMRWELRAALDKISDQIPLYVCKNICYVHVVPKDSTAHADNDNYDTKQITDTIIEYILGTDNGLVCSFSFYGIEEGELPVGSYAIVSPDHNAPPSLASLLPLLKAAFSV